MQKLKFITLAIFLTLMGLIAAEDDIEKLHGDMVPGGDTVERNAEVVEENIPVLVELTGDIDNKSDINKNGFTNSWEANEKSLEQAVPVNNEQKDDENVIPSKEHSKIHKRFSYEELSDEEEKDTKDHADKSEDIPKLKMKSDKTIPLERIASILSALLLEEKPAADDINSSETKSVIDRYENVGLQKIIYNPKINASDFTQTKISLPGKMEDVAQAPIVEEYSMQSGTNRHLNDIPQQPTCLQPLHDGQLFNPALLTSPQYLGRLNNPPDSLKTKLEIHPDIMSDQNSYPYSSYPDMRNQNSYPYSTIHNLYQVHYSLTSQDSDRNESKIEFNVPNMEYNIDHVPNIKYKIPDVEYKIPHTDFIENMESKVPNYNIFEKSPMKATKLPFVEDRWLRQVVGNTAPVENPIFRFSNYPFAKYGYLLGNYVPSVL